MSLTLTAYAWRRGEREPMLLLRCLLFVGKFRPEAEEARIEFFRDRMIA